MKDFAGGYYHVYNRGCNRERIFYSDDNYRHLLRLMHRFVPKSVTIIAYCLMSNHYHLLLHTKEDGAIGRFIQRTFNAYTQSVNLDRGRSGTLFEGRAKSVHVEEERYAIHLCRYIHLNPVVAEIVSTPLDWPYSNYAEFVGRRKGTLWDPPFVEAHCGTAAAHEEFVISSVDEAMAAKIAKYCPD